MLVARRKEGQWITVTHKSGDVLRICLKRIKQYYLPPGGEADLLFDDDARNFLIVRPDGKVRPSSVLTERGNNK